MHREDLGKQTRKALLALAQQHGVTGISRLRKPELIERLRQALASSPEGPPPAAASAPFIPSKKKPRAKSQRKKATPSPSTGLLSGRAFDLHLSEQIGRPAPPEQSTAPATHDQLDVAQAVAESKFFLGSQPEAAVAPEEALPASYDDNRLVLLARDPHWLYAYWDFNATRFSDVHSRLEGNEHSLVLRVFDVTYLEFNGRNAWNVTDIELAPFATNWYIPVPQAETAYCAEIGYRSHNVQFVALGRSNIVTTPRADLSPSTSVRWLTPPERRMTTPSTTQTPRSTFAQEEAPGFSQHDHAAITLSSAEHPFSWGASHKITATPPLSKEHE